MLSALIYIALGGLFALGLATYRKPSAPHAPNWMWIVTIAAWPLAVLIFVVLIYRVVQERLAPESTKKN